VQTSQILHIALPLPGSIQWIFIIRTQVSCIN